MDARISLVIPAYNEERYLPRLLDGVAAARARYRGGAEAIEVIVTDNGSRDEILAFVDADFRVHPDTFNAIDAYFADRRRIVGLTGCIPERSSPGIEASWWLLGAFTVMTGYGVPLARSECMPSGVVCCRREDWERIGGYCERRAFFEDVRFVLDLQDLGWRRGQSAGWIAGAPAICSTRKFDRFGDWHYLSLPAFFMMGSLFAPAAVGRWAERYWYGSQRER